MNPAARALARDILSRNASGESYRKIAASFPRRADGSQIVKAGTLDRIAKTGGAWLPKDREILTALGLRKVKVLTPMQIRIREMASQTREALKWKRRKEW